MSNKYFIYANGRWCEVDTRRGRVQGFRERAHFCYLRGGRLEVERTATVLRALRALAAGAGGAARDSAPLRHRRRHKPRQESARAHRCCSQHHHHSRCDVNANELGDKPTSAVEAQGTSPRKRKRSTGDESNSKAKQRKSDEVAGKEKSPDSNAVKDEAKLFVKHLLEDTKHKKVSPQKNTVKVRGPEEEKLVQSLLESSPSEDIKERTQSPKKKLGLSHKQDKESQKSPQKLQKAKTVVRGKEEEKLFEFLLQSSSDVEQDQTKTQPSSKSWPRVESDSSSTSSERNACKELVIDDDDVRILRGFLARAPGRDKLERFDEDVDYKTRVFYKINPLVCLKRCGPLEKLLTQRLSLKEFARHLGLRSVADVTPEKRYRMRHTTRQARNTTSVTSESENEKVNAVLPKRRQLWNRDKELFNNSQSPQSSELKVKPQVQRPTRNSSRDTTDSDTEVKQHIRRHLERRASVRLNPERKQTKTNKDDESMVVESDSDENSKSVNQRKTRRKSKGTAENNESVPVSDDNNGNADVDQKKTKRKSTVTEDKETVLVSDESDSAEDQKQRKSKSRTADDESVVISDESEQSNSTNESAGSRRRTRSQGPEKRVLRERNKSVLISDTDSNNAQKNRRNTKTKSKETDKTHGKSNVVSDSNTDVNLGKNDRIRSRDPNRALKDNKANDSNAKKVSDIETKKDVDNPIETKKITRSSIKVTEDNSQSNDKAKNSKKDGKSSKIDNTSNQRKEDKPGPSRRAIKESQKKPVIDKDQHHSEISDSSDAFETSKLSPKKNKDEVGKYLPETISATNMPRNRKGKFMKRKSENGDSKNKINEKEKNHRDNDGIEKADDKNRNRGNDKNITDNETDKEKNKVLRDRIDRDKEENERSKGSDNKKTENKGKENNRKAVAARSMFVKPVKFKKSCVANGREYSSLEDHAIVAWISAGNRMRMVNGNAVWRELQSEYTRLTAQTRSWHSLRNRYLRYILPTLGELALPPSQVSRLRAAAAVGKIKGASRRNSIFKSQRVVSASTAGRLRFRPPSDSESDPYKKAPTPPPSPRRRPAPSLANPSPPSPSPASPPRAKRLRSSNATATPTPKKRRIHHL